MTQFPKLDFSEHINFLMSECARVSSAARAYRNRGELEISSACQLTARKYFLAAQALRDIST